MARRTHLALSLAALLAGSIVASAQTMASAPTGQAKSQSGHPGSSADRDADKIADVSLGDAAVPLYGPWKFTVGDSPIDPRTGQPLWAEPSFDDSKWVTVDLTPKDGAVDPVGGLSGYVPGWTAKGHPG